MAVKKSPPPPSTDPKGRWAYSPSVVKKAKKNKGLSYLSDFTPGPSEVSIVGVEVESRGPQDLAWTTPSSIGEALEMEERGPVATVEAQAEVSRA